MQLTFPRPSLSEAISEAVCDAMNDGTTAADAMLALRGVENKLAELMRQDEQAFEILDVDASCAHH